MRKLLAILVLALAPTAAFAASISNGFVVEIGRAHV